MKNWKTKNGFNVVQLLSGRSNAYLLLKDQLVILIDTGKKSACKKLLRQIRSLGLSGDKITHLILTHTHFDHCQSAAKIKEISSCSIVVSGMATHSIAAGYTTLPRGTTCLTNLLSAIGRWIGRKGFGYQPFVADQLIRGDVDFMDAGSLIRIVETPGHSDDSIAVIVDDEIAVVGDVMFGVFRNSIYPPFADHPGTTIQSWKRLLDTPCSTFLPGHGKKITRDLLASQYTKYARELNP